MKITIVIENTKKEESLNCEHGLSIYLESKKHKLLMDTGSSGIAWDNAKALGIDLKEIDTVVLSHGHYDHTGGVLAFAKENDKAEIYIQKTAKRQYMSAKGGDHFIGVDPKVFELDKVHLLEGDYKIDEELEIFTGVTGRRYWPEGNKKLFVRDQEGDHQDIFDHEEYLSVMAEGKKVLISGCAHNGILNILDKYREIYGEDPDLVLSGFHMMKSDAYTQEDIDLIQDTARELKKLKTVFYTGHCTSLPGYELMKEIMGDRLHYMYTGREIVL